MSKQSFLVLPTGRVFASFLLVLISFASNPTKCVAETISDIKVSGTARVENSSVLLQVQSEIGSELQSDLVEEDIRRIFRMGYFAAVEAYVDNGVLEFRLKERPAIRNIEIKGYDELSEKTVEEQLKLPSRRFLDRRKIALGIDELKRYYEQEGYFGTEVEYRIEPLTEDQVDLVIQITEGEKKVIRAIRFEGADSIEEDELLDQLQTSTYSWWISWLTGSGVVKDEFLERDVALVTQYYLNHGYLDVNVTKPLIETKDDGIDLIFQVQEGAQFSVRSVSVAGDLLEGGADKTLEGIATKAGEIFNVGVVREDTFKISEKFTDIGYAFANVEPVTKIDRTENKVDLSYQVAKGNLITVDEILLSGNQKTRDNVIRRSMKINERELFSSSAIKRSQELLQRLGYFDEVTITPEPSDGEDEVDLNVAVREGSTGTFSAGAGLSSGDGFIISTRISENNLFGSGNSLTLDINTGSRRENYVLSFDNPRVNDTRWSLGVDALAVERVYDDFDRNQAGGSIRVGYPLWFLGADYLDDVRFSFGYEFLKIRIDDVDENAPQLVMDEAGSSTSSSVTPSIVRNTIDNPLFPTSGSRQFLSVEAAGLGGDERFWLSQFTNTWYYQIWKSPIGSFIFSNRFKLGWGESYNSDPFPLFRRFFPGGINSVRGFDSRELGPKDGEGNEFGGNKQLVTNFEIIFPLVESFGLNGVVFYDIGNAFDDDVDISYESLRHAIGWGVRWRSPIAPIRVEFGYPLDKEEGDKSVVTHFSFGSPL